MCGGVKRISHPFAGMYTNISLGYFSTLVFFFENCFSHIKMFLNTHQNQNDINILNGIKPTVAILIFHE